MKNSCKFIKARIYYKKQWLLSEIMNIIDKKKLANLAKASVDIGLNLQKGQDLLITAPIESLPLIREIAKYANHKGCGIITPFFYDDEIALARYSNSNDAVYDRASDWLYEAMAKAYKNGAARLAIAGDNPMLFADINQELVSRVNKAASIAAKPALEQITQFTINWSIASYPSLSWAKLVFPNLSDEEAVKALSEAIFKASRVDGDNVIEAWKEHNNELHKRSKWLNEQNFEYLHFKSDKTNLKIGLADDHYWQGGAAQAKNGVICNANIPTEEVFTTPHAHKVEGVVYATKPLSYQGTLIENIMMRFEEGAVVEATASKGQEVLQKLLASDAGAARLGEVALVPHSSPISASGLLFYNTLYDENAACHIAMGQCYSKCFKNGTNLNTDEIAQKGGNSSFIHVDWMIGSNNIDIDGITITGEAVPIFRKGEWAN